MSTPNGQMYPIRIIRSKSESEIESKRTNDNFYVRNSHVTLKLTTIPKVCLINDNFCFGYVNRGNDNTNEFAQDGKCHGM